MRQKTFLEIERQKRLNELRSVSPITYSLTMAFYWLELLSPTTWFLKSRTVMQDERMETFRRPTISRARGVELVLLIWLIVGIICAILSTSTSSHLRAVIIVISAFRIIDIIQVAGNITMFGAERAEPKKHAHAKTSRTVVLAAWNYVELMILFANIYAASTSGFVEKSTISWTDAMYVSVGSQLTTTFGGITPTGSVLTVTYIQALVGFFFGIYVLSRFIALLPPIIDVMELTDATKKDKSSTNS